MSYIRLRLSLVAAAVAPALLLAAPAAADTRVSAEVRGSAHVGASVTVRDRRPAPRDRDSRVRVTDRRRTRRSVGIAVGGHVSVGGGVYVSTYAPPPPPPPPPLACAPGYCGYPPPMAVVYYPARPPLPRFGIGAFLGGTDVEGVGGGGDVGLLARLRLTRGGALGLEGELSGTEHQDSARVDRRLGVALIWDLAPRSRLAPYLLAGTGVSVADLGSRELEQGYGELGVGLALRLTDHFHLAADFRAGTRARGDEDEAYKASETLLIPEEEEYARSRLSAMIYF